MLQLSLAVLVLAWAASVARLVREWRGAPARKTSVR